MRFKLQAASNKRQATSVKLRRLVNYSPGSNMIFYISQTKGEKYESNSRSRVEMAGRTGTSSRKCSYACPEKSRLRRREDLYSGTSPGRQTRNKIQRRRPDASRRGSVSGLSHLRKNLITTVAPARAGAAAFCRASLCLRKKQKAASVKQQATSSKRQAGLVRKLLGCDILSRVTMSQRLKVQATSVKPQATSIKLQATSG
jgi:hypothetical protein